MDSLSKILSQELIESLQKVGHQKTYQAGEQIFGEGEKAEFLPIIVAGKVKIVRFLFEGKEIILNIFQGGESFAIPPIYQGGNYPATAIAMEKTEILIIYRQDFLELLRKSDEFSALMMSKMSTLLRETTFSMQNLATSSPEQRVGNVLFHLAEKENFVMPFKVSLRRQDIADMSGLTTETTIRVIRRLAEKDLIKIVRGKIFIEDYKKLKAFLQ